MGASLLSVVLLMGAAWFARARYLAAGPLLASQVVVIPRGTPAQVGDALAAARVIDNATEFRVAAALTRWAGPLHTGELAFPALASLSDTLDVLRFGHPVQHRVTIPEGLTAAQIAVLLDRTAALGGDPVVPAEGAMLPETYDFDHGATRASIMQRAEDAMDHALTGIWAGRSDEVKLDSPRQLVTLASIVERETARPEERAHIASVFLNRLRRGMRLQSDPTVIYAVTGGAGVSEHPITRAELDWSNPYNTYTIPALPPGPIDSPGIAAMQAVAHPMTTDDLYFVADGQGGHAFAATLEEHRHKVAAWRALAAQPAATPNGK